MIVTPVLSNRNKSAFLEMRLKETKPKIAKNLMVFAEAMSRKLN